MSVRAVDDKSSDTLVVVSGEGFWTGSSTLPHLHQRFSLREVALSAPHRECCRTPPCRDLGIDPESPVIPEFAGFLPAAGVRLPLPCLAPLFGLLSRLPKTDHVVAAFR